MSDQDALQGYAGEVRALLEEAGIKIGDEVEVQAGEEVYRRILKLTISLESTSNLLTLSLNS